MPRSTGWTWWKLQRIRLESKIGRPRNRGGQSGSLTDDYFFRPLVRSASPETASVARDSIGLFFSSRNE